MTTAIKWAIALGILSVALLASGCRDSEPAFVWAPSPTPADTQQPAPETRPTAAPGVSDATALPAIKPERDSTASSPPTAPPAALPPARPTATLPAAEYAPAATATPPAPARQSIPPAVPHIPAPAPEPTPESTPGPAPTPTPFPSPGVEPAPAPTPTPKPSLEPEPTPPPTRLPMPSVAPAPARTPTPLPAPGPATAPAPAPTPTRPPPAAAVALRIECIFYDGAVRSTEADEYVQIINSGAEPVDLARWTLVDLDDGRPNFAFPGLTLSPGVRVRVYTNEDHPEWASLSFGWGQSIWNNTTPDTAALIDPEGAIVAAGSYPPGC